MEPTNQRARYGDVGWCMVCFDRFKRPAESEPFRGSGGGGALYGIMFLWYGLICSFPTF